MASTVAMFLVMGTVPVLAAAMARRVLRVAPVEMDLQDAFGRARRRHVRAVLLTSLSGRPRALGLPVLPPPYGVGSARPAQRDVPLCRIVGSVDGGRHLFDRHFDPVTDDAWSRFSSLLAARRAGVGLPPVLLLRAPDGYYVLDGHHRVAVARALGESHVWADVSDVSG